MIKRHKEIIAISISLLLLAVMLVQWGREVYWSTCTDIEEEANIVFLLSVQEARDSIYGMDRLALPTQRDTGKISRINHLKINGRKKVLDSIFSLDNYLTDTNDLEKSKFDIKIFTFQAKDTLFPVNEDTAKVDEDKFVELHELIFKKVKSDYIKELKISLNDENAEVLMSFDSIKVIDTYNNIDILRSLFRENLRRSDLELLRDTVAQIGTTVHTSTEPFYTDALSIGETGFNNKKYFGIIENVSNQALRRALPKFIAGFGLFILFGLVFGVLYRSIQQQKRLVKMKNDLVSNISHELKTPISVVNVALEALQDFDAASDPEKTQRYIEISQKEMLRLSSLVDKVMDQSVNPDHEAPRTKVALASVGKEVIDSMSIRLNDRPLRIDYTHEGEPMVLAHVPDVKSVLYNLIDNAIKYSSEGVVKVHVKSCDNEAVITVKDQGIGIDPMYQDEVFDNFFRVPTDNIHNVKGYGLGLYHVKQIVEKYGGKIGMKSIPGEGSTFTIKWPLVR